MAGILKFTRKQQARCSIDFHVQLPLPFATFSHAEQWKFDYNVIGLNLKLCQCLHSVVLLLIWSKNNLHLPNPSEKDRIEIVSRPLIDQEAMKTSRLGTLLWKQWKAYNQS